MTEDPVTAAAKRLSAARIESSRLDARLLWEYAQKIAVDANGGENAVDVFDKLVGRRMAREPLAYIVGHKEFWSLEFLVGSGVLVPRPETETLIEGVCNSYPDHQERLSVLDLGTGSGCLLIAALKEYPNAHGIGIDASAEALAWAKRNVAAHELEDRVSLIESGWLEEASPGFDVLVCNPPYIAAGDIDALEPEVSQFEPRPALDGGADGLDAYRALAQRIGRLLAPKGSAFVEIGAGQSDAVRRIFESRHLKVAAITPDLSRIPRCLVLKRDNHDG